LSPRTRTAVAVVCIAFVIAAAFVPVVASNFGAAILVPLGLVLPAVIITIVRREAFRCDEQSISLLSLLDLRAPPTLA
jgi:hypothetical protein